jgi:hypothetical protein
MKSKVSITNVEDKSLKQLERIENKYLKKIETLKNFLTTANDFDIELVDLQKNMVDEKINFYNKEYIKINLFKEWKYLHDCEPKMIVLWGSLKEDDLERIRMKYLRFKKLTRLKKTTEK